MTAYPFFLERPSGGGYTGVVPPVPIPNTEVKYSKADDSWFSPAKVGRSLTMSIRQRAFLLGQKIICPFILPKIRL